MDDHTVDHEAKDHDDESPLMTTREAIVDVGHISIVEETHKFYGRADKKRENSSSGADDKEEEDELDEVDDEDADEE